MSDWGAGKYEIMAAQLEPVAGIVVDSVEPVSGLKVLDLACGTGNASLLAASRGAEVTGLDVAPRLLEVAAERAAEAGAEIDWVEGSMLDLPFEDDSFDVVTSVFGVIFGDPPAAVAEEIARVLATQGRVALTAWTNDGVLPEIAKLSRQAVADAFDLPPDEHPAFQWGDEATLRELFSEHGIALQCETKPITFTDASPEAAIAEWKEHHPMWVNLKQAIGDERFEALSEQAVEIFERGNEATDGGFSYTSTYLLALGSPV